MNYQESTIAVIGLGYVGLPLAVAFGKKRQVIGYDLNELRVDELKDKYDRTLEVSADQLREAEYLACTSDSDELKKCKIFIVTVPTPVDKANRPDLTPLIKASELIGGLMPDDALIIYESTVYPGATEEICVPILEKSSGKKFNANFFCGYSPERINPGDKSRSVTTIKKVTSGSNPEIATVVDALYCEIVSAGTHKAASIKVAEAAKVIENTQRDLNIALMNELALIFDRIGIDTLQVIEAASTKWNFLPFKPGLVGGHCIGVDPYYLTHKAQEVGYHPEVILAGRRVNNAIVQHVAANVIKLMLKRKLPIVGGKILVLGLAFKENCPDVRNTKIAELVVALQDYDAQVDVYDPWVDGAEAKREYGIACLPDLSFDIKYDGIVVAVGHQEFIEMGIEGVRSLGGDNSVIYDVKGLFEKSLTTARL